MTVDGSDTVLLKPLPLDPLPSSPLVSVLIGNYNYGNYLGEAIESVLRQSYSRLELIVCDDGSTDDSCAVVEEYTRRDPRVTLLRQENAGQGSAFFSAYRQSSGQIICLLDSDDTYAPVKVQRVVEAFVRNPEVGMVAHRVLRVNGRGEARGVLPFVASNSAQWWGPTLLQNGGILRNLPPCSGLSMRRPISDDVFPLFQHPDLRGYFGDRVPKLVAPLMTPVLVLPEPLARYRLHGHNRTGSARMTIEFLERELGQLAVGWEAQRRYLDAAHPAAARAFAPLESPLTFRLLQYMRARLRRSNNVRQAYQRVIHHQEFQSEPWFLRWFWRGSILLPQPIFEHAINVVMGNGIIKEIAARFAIGGI